MNQSPDPAGAVHVTIAVGTGLALPIVDLEAVLEVTELTIGRGVVAKGRAAGRDRLQQRLPDRGGQTPGPLAGDRPRPALGRNARPVQAFADVNVAESGDHALIEQGHFDRPAFAGESRIQRHGVEAVSQRIGSQMGEQFVIIQFFGLDQGHEPEAAGIAKPDGARIQLEIHMVMGPRRRQAVAENGHPSRHAQVYDECPPVIQCNEDVLGPPPQMQNPAVFKARRHIAWKGNSEIPAPDDRARDRSAFHRRRQPPAHGFNFGQFGHGNKVAVSGGFRYGPLMAKQPPGTQGESASGETASFGFRNVGADEKPKMVRAVFDSVSARYDLMNDLMSGGVHRLWKGALLDRVKPRPGDHLLDVGGGTGDIAFRFIERGGGSVTVCDINRNMLEAGRDRGLDHGVLREVTWICGDAEQLPIADGSVETFATAFCFRNVTDLPAALSEARRVLTPGGRFLCLEFSKVILPVLSELYDAYSFRVLPALGELVANDREAYQYLAESIRRFPGQAEYETMIRAAGLDMVKYTNLSGGIAAIHEGWRI